MLQTRKIHHQLHHESEHHSGRHPVSRTERNPERHRLSAMAVQKGACQTPVSPEKLKVFWGKLCKDC